MEKKKEPSPFAMFRKWAEKYHGGFYGAVITAVIGVAGTMFSYISVAQIIRILIGKGEWDACIPWIIGVAAGYLIKAIWSTVSTTLSHGATYHTLRDLREKMLQKLSRMPMGVILDTPSGQYKTTIVDRVEGMEAGCAGTGETGDTGCFGINRDCPERCFFCLRRGIGGCVKTYQSGYQTGHGNGTGRIS